MVFLFVYKMIYTNKLLNIEFINNHIICIINYSTLWSSSFSNIELFILLVYIVFRKIKTKMLSIFTTWTQCIIIVTVIIFIILLVENWMLLPSYSYSKYRLFNIIEPMNYFFSVWESLIQALPLMFYLLFVISQHMVW